LQAAPVERPLWLLNAPLPLDVQDGRPHLDGALELEPDAERIESGWWDGNDVRRDYFVACDAAGARLWVYRELSADGGWWLHGVFG
jgi:protein ImuB